jgi:hypothetical protein
VKCIQYGSTIVPVRYYEEMKHVSSYIFYNTLYSTVYDTRGARLQRDARREGDPLFGTRVHDAGPII